MPQKVSPVEQRYGRLQPLDYIWGKGWRCACDCGNETVVTGGNLRAGNVQSCGCYRIEKCRETGRKAGAALRDSGEPFGWDLYRLTRKRVADKQVQVRPMLNKRKRSDKAKPCWCCRRPTKNFICIKCSGGNNARHIHTKAIPRSR